MPPRISVIIVVFNAASTLEMAMNSVLQQRYEKVELIVIDGGSEDGTIEILKKYTSENLLWMSEPDHGIYDAMNKGIRIASGEWIYFLGADDELYDSEVLNNLFGENNFENIGFIYGNVKIGDRKKPYDGVFDFRKLLEKNISHQAVFYKKNIFDETSNYNVRYTTHADWDLNLRCFENKKIGVKYIAKTIARFSSGGASINYDILFLRESLMPRKMDFLKENGSKLYDLKNYDEWWRFIRNANLRSEDDFIKSGYHLAIQPIILSMAIRQNKLPQPLLRKGVFSKIFMFLNYLFSNHKTNN